MSLYFLNALLRSRHTSRHTESLSLPQKLAGYSLVKRVNKSYSVQKYATGVYRKNNKKFFIKISQGPKKDLGYYSLAQEFTNSCTVYKVLQRLKKGKQTFTSPRPIEWIELPPYRASVYQFIPGRTLSSYPAHVQSTAIIRLLHSLEKIGKHFTPEEKRGFPRRSRAVLFVLLVFFMLYMAATESKYLPSILKAGMYALFSLSFFKLFHPLVFAHRDLIPENVLVWDKKLYLCDWSYAAFVVSGYDHAYVHFNFEYIHRLRLISRQRQYAAERILKKFIALQHIFFETKAMRKQYVLSRLNRI